MDGNAMISEKHEKYRITFAPSNAGTMHFYCGS